MDQYTGVWIKLRDSESKELHVILPDVPKEIAYFKQRIIIRRRKDKLLKYDIDNNYKLEFINLGRMDESKPQIKMRIVLKVTPVITLGKLL